jgi:hypothetical protein
MNLPTLIAAIGRRRRPFSPLQIPGLALWINANAANVTKDGSNRVSAATDLSGNGRTASQGTGAAQPLWVPGGVNGKDVLTFDGARSLVTGAFALNQPTTVFISAMTTSAATLQTFVDGAAALNTARFYVSGSNLSMFAGSGVIDGLLTNNAWFIGGALFQNASSFLQKDGVEITGTCGVNNASGITVGFGGGNTAGSALVGSIRQVIVYSAALTLAQRNAVKNYLAADAAVVVV